MKQRTPGALGHWKKQGRFPCHLQKKRLSVLAQWNQAVHEPPEWADNNFVLL